MRRLHVVGLTMLALCVPPFAFGGEEAPAGPQSLQVSASLGGCGLAEAAIVCTIEASWNAIEGADSYAVSVTRPDGSVLDVGEGAGTGRTVFVPYVGPGNYSIQVTAWGTPPGDDDAEVLARDRATSTDAAQRSAGRDVASRPDGRAPNGDGRPAAGGDSGATAEQPVAGEEPALAPPECAAEDEPEDGTAEDVIADLTLGVSDEPPAPEEPGAGEYDPGDADGDGRCPLSTSP
jgi:hypothetical protein